MGFVYWSHNYNFKTITKVSELWQFSLLDETFTIQWEGNRHKNSDKQGQKSLEKYWDWNYTGLTKAWLALLNFHIASKAHFWLGSKWLVCEAQKLARWIMRGWFSCARLTGRLLFSCRNETQRYTALGSTACDEVVECLELEKRSKERALQICRAFIKKSTRYSLLQQLNNIGNAKILFFLTFKNSFVVN